MYENVKQKSNENYVVNKVLKRYLKRLDWVLENVDDSKLCVCMHQGKISEDGFIESIFKDISMILEKKIISIPNLYMYNKIKTNQEKAITNVMIQEFDLIIDRFIIILETMNYQEAIFYYLSDFKPEIAKSYEKFKKDMKFSIQQN